MKKLGENKCLRPGMEHLWFFFMNDFIPERLYVCEVVDIQTRISHENRFIVPNDRNRKVDRLSTRVGHGVARNAGKRS
jgi:hypothetical protein